MITLHINKHKLLNKLISCLLYKLSRDKGVAVILEETRNPIHTMLKQI